MPTSETPDPTLPEAEPEGQGTAVLAQVLYLSNLLLVPGISFFVLVWLYLRKSQNTPPLAVAHLDQTFFASLWAGALLVVVSLLIVVLGGFDGPWMWTVVITYFTVCHSTLVMLGILGLAKAMSGQCFRFPLVGRPLPEECRQWQRSGGLL